MLNRNTRSILLLLSLAACGPKPADNAPGADLAAGKRDSLTPIGDVQSLPPAKVDTTPVVPPPPAKTTTKPPVKKPPTVVTKPIPSEPPKATPPAPKPAATAPAIESGTTVTTTMIDSVHSRYTKVGDVVRTRVAQDVVGGDGRVVIPAGSIVAMRVTEIAMANSRGEKGTLNLSATTVDVQGMSHTLTAKATDYEYEMRARGVTSGDVAKTGAGAVAGAILGRVIGGKKGTIVGAVGGGAVGAAVASSTADRDIIVHAGTKLTLTLGDKYTAS